LTGTKAPRNSVSQQVSRLSDGLLQLLLIRVAIDDVIRMLDDSECLPIHQPERLLSVGDSRRQ